MKPLSLKDNTPPDKPVYTTKAELKLFLNLVDTNPKIQEFLLHDNTFILADKYLIAMVFIYFKRAYLNPEDYTDLNFFAGLCLAHSMEEDINLSTEIYPWALGNELKNELPRLLELKILLWIAMDYRAAVSRHCCNQLISVFEKHSVWRRERISTNIIVPYPLRTTEEKLINEFKSHDRLRLRTLRH